MSAVGQVPSEDESVIGYVFFFILNIPLLIKALQQMFEPKK